MLTKDEIEEKEMNWDWIAKENGYTCDRCGNIPPYGERDIYFETGLCGWCDHIEKKDD